jgi:hypothetical protein
VGAVQDLARASFTVNANGVAREDAQALSNDGHKVRPVVGMDTIGRAAAPVGEPRRQADRTPPGPQGAAAGSAGDYTTNTHLTARWQYVPAVAADLDAGAFPDGTPLTDIAEELGVTIREARHLVMGFEPRSALAPRRACRHETTPAAGTHVPTAVAPAAQSVPLTGLGLHRSATRASGSNASYNSGGVFARRRAISASEMKRPMEEPRPRAVPARQGPNAGMSDQGRSTPQGR